MRLIDADKLKEEVKNTVPYVEQDRLLDLIDDSPTVEQPYYAMGYQDEVRTVLKEVAEGKHRPQGEWIEKRDNNGNVQIYCNVCGKKAQVGYIEFCGCCGADMRGEEE